MSPIRILAASFLAFALSAQAQTGPRIEHWTSDSGTPVYFIAAPQIPMLDIQVVLDAGNSRDDTLPGLSQITHALLNTGAGDLDADAIARQFEDVGAAYGAEVRLDRSTLSLRTLVDPEWREQALRTFVTVIGQPGFPESELERRRQQMQVALKKIEEDPGALAKRAFYQAVYPGHPYSSPPAGTEDSLAAISRGDVEGFYRTFFASGGALVAMVGAVNRTEAEAIANRISQALPRGPAPNPLPPPTAVTEAKTVILPHPSEQAHVLVGQQGVARGEAFHFPLYLGNYTLGGGGFSSRLMQEIRNNRGLAYSVYSYFFPMRHPGPFRLGFQTQKDQVDQALEAATAELRRFLADGPTEEELTHSRNSLMLGFPLRIADNASMIDYLSMIGYYRLPLDYLETWADRIGAISHEQIVTAFQSRLDPDQMITVIVGGQSQP